VITNLVISICEQESVLSAIVMFFFFFQPCIDSEDKQVQLITTLDNKEVDLLTLEYIKVCVVPHVLTDPFQICRYPE